MASVLTGTCGASAVAIGPSALAVAALPPSGAVAAFAALAAAATFTSVTPLAAVAATTRGATLVNALPHQRRGDQRSITAGAVQLQPVRLAPRGPRRQDCHDAHPVQVAVDLGAQYVAHLGSPRDEGTVQRAARLPGAGGAPCPGTVIPGAGELDLDPAGHRQINASAAGSRRHQRRSHASGSRSNWSTWAGRRPAATSASVTSSRTVRSAARVATHTAWSPAAGPR